MAVLPEIAELFQTSAAFILHGVEPAGEELAALRREIAELRMVVDEEVQHLDRVHTSVEALATTVASILDRLVLLSGDGNVLEDAAREVDAG